MNLPPSQDLPAPRGGPPFARLASWPYRAEMLLLTLVLTGFLVGRAITVRDVDWAWTGFWFLWPDLVAFVPIGVAARGGAGWPSWGSALYDILHTFLLWLPAFLAAWLWLGTPWWPLLGWAVHITMDRTVGYYLRASPGAASSPGA